MRRRVLSWLVVLVLLASALAVALTTSGSRGYLSPVFAPDGASVYVVVREVNASIVGLGYDTFTPPASVWLHRDRFTLVNIRLADRRVTVVREFPPSPLEGTRFSAYHGAIYGEGDAHLRWADPEHLEYELSVTKPEVPSSRTWVWRHRWSTKSRVTEDSSAWQPGSSGMSGDEPAQLSGDVEVIAARGAEGLPCAVVLLRTGEAAATTLADTGGCGSSYPDGFTRAALADQTRRAAIERSQMLTKTYDDLVTQGRAQGLSEGTAMLEANRGMQRLGLFPKETTITATAAPCDSPLPVFRISDEEFRVGLFQDIEKAIDHPGDEVDRGGTYVTYRDHDTSRRLNAFLADPAHRDYLVEGRGGCWHIRINRP